MHTTNLICYPTLLVAYFNTKNWITACFQRCCRPILHLLNRSALFILYCSLFLPYLTYCAEIWGNTYKSNTQCIFLLQKKIVRIIYGANFKDHTNVIFQDLHFFKFCYLVKLKTCEVIYRAFNKTLTVNLNNIFTVCEPNILFNMRTKRCTEIYSD